MVPCPELQHLGTDLGYRRGLEGAFDYSNFTTCILSLPLSHRPIAGRAGPDGEKWMNSPMMALTT